MVHTLSPKGELLPPRHGERRDEEDGKRWGIPPSGRVSEQGPDWFLVATEAFGGGTPDLLYSPVFLGYMDIYRRKKSVRGAMRGPRGWGRTQGAGSPPCLVATLKLPWLQLQVSWITFVPKITLPKVSFRLDSVWYPFSAKHWNKEKNRNWHWALG